MVITLLLSSLIGGLFGVGLGIYWGFGIVMIGLCYILGGMFGSLTSLTLALSRFSAQARPLHDTTPKTAPQFNS